MTPVVHLGLRISPWMFEKIWNDAMIFSGTRGKMYHEKNLVQKSRGTVPLKLSCEGNTVVCKPSEMTSVTAWMLAQISKEVSLYMYRYLFWMSVWKYTRDLQLCWIELKRWMQVPQHVGIFKKKAGEIQDGCIAQNKPKTYSGITGGGWDTARSLPVRSWLQFYL